MELKIENQVENLTATKAVCFVEVINSVLKAADEQTLRYLMSRLAYTTPLTVYFDYTVSVLITFGWQTLIRRLNHVFYLQSFNHGGASPHNQISTYNVLRLILITKNYGHFSKENYFD